MVLYLAGDTPSVMKMGAPEKFAFTADSIILSEDRIALIKRKNPPFQGNYALPGGFVDPGETVEDACIREAKEETDLDVEIKRLVGVYSKPDRDPRGRTITVAFICKPVGGHISAKDDAAAAEWIPTSELPDVELAFDHRQILIDAGLIPR